MVELRYWSRLFFPVVFIALCSGCSGEGETHDVDDTGVGTDVSINQGEQGDVSQPDVSQPGDDTDVDAASNDVDSGSGGDTDSDSDAGANDEENDDPLACPPRASAQGEVVDVSPEDVDELPNMVRTAESGTTFVLADGTYEIPDTIQVRAEDITLRSASDDRDAVVIDGRYEVNSLIYATASDMTVAHLTLTRAVHHPIHVTPGAEETTSVTGTDIYDVAITDASQQFIKINGNSDRTAFVDEGRVECSYFELTDAGRPHVDRTATGCYTGGVDAHGARDWVVRNNEFHDIYCAGEGLAQHAIHFWTGSRDTLVENNWIYNCARGIGFGLRQSGEARTYDDELYAELEGLIGHYDGLIRNNVIFADHEWYDTGIEIAQNPGGRVYHNTIYSVEATESFASIDYRFENTDAEIRNNLTDRISVRNDASGTVDHNLESIGPELFVDAAQRDFHLVSEATEAIEQGIDVPEAGVDMDGESRPKGAAPDIGADEY